MTKRNEGACVLPHLFGYQAAQTAFRVPSVLFLSLRATGGAVPEPLDEYHMQKISSIAAPDRRGHSGSRGGHDVGGRGNDGALQTITESGAHAGLAKHGNAPIFLDRRSLFKKRLSPDSGKPFFLRHVHFCSAARTASKRSSTASISAGRRFLPSAASASGRP